jgi:nucleotide-binding universal stress UspA family protein
MTEIRRILCPIDFSDFSRRALDHAVAIAKTYRSTVTVLHVSTIAPVAAYVSGSGLPPHTSLTPLDREALLASVKRFATIDAGAGVSLECDVAEGPAATAILAWADAMPADLLVLGTHGRSGFERLVLGSVAEKVLRKATCPVLTVPGGAGKETLAPPVMFRRILCALDFSDCSIHALRFAMSLAEQTEAHLTVLHVIELPPDIPREPHEPILAAPRDLREYIALAEDDCTRRLQKVIPDALRVRGIVDTLLATGKPYREVLRVAAEKNSDLIVIGIHGRGPIDRLFFGSTTEQVVRHATCPVLTLRT